MEQETRRGAIGNLSCHSIFQHLMQMGYFGHQMRDQIKTMNIVSKQAGFPSIFDPYLSVSKNIKYITSGAERMKQHYRKHNLYVINTIPKENLLVWNVKVR